MIKMIERELNKYKRVRFGYKPSTIEIEHEKKEEWNWLGIIFYCLWIFSGICIAFLMDYYSISTTIFFIFFIIFLVVPATMSLKCPSIFRKIEIEHKENENELNRLGKIRALKILFLFMFLVMFLGIIYFNLVFEFVLLALLGLTIKYFVKFIWWLDKKVGPTDF